MSNTLPQQWKPYLAPIAQTEFLALEALHLKDHLEIHVRLLSQNSETVHWSIVIRNPMFLRIYPIELIDTTTVRANADFGCLLELYESSWTRSLKEIHLDLFLFDSSEAPLRHFVIITENKVIECLSSREIEFSQIQLLT